MTSRPHLYALPPGIDYAQELIRGIDQRLGHDPALLGRSEIWVNTQRARRRLNDIYQSGPARIIPRIRLVTDLDPLVADRMAPGVSDLRRRLQILRLVSKLIELRPEFSAGSGAVELTESLALLFTEMADEGVEYPDIAKIAPDDLSGHWQNGLEFLKIVTQADLQPDQASLRRVVSDHLAAKWAETPPKHPIFLAGSTGSRGPVFALIRALLKLENGYVILPGFDFHKAQSTWGAFDRPGRADDHPQHRFFRIAQAIGISPDSIEAWTDRPEPEPARNRLISVALRPAPVTDGWLADGPDLGVMPPICRSAALIEAPDPRAEALAIAVRMRAALEEGNSVALITPDRRLSRRVSAALDRWHITPDDSAGEPVADTAQGRFLKLVLSMCIGRPSSQDLVAVLTNPVSASGGNRLQHLRFARDLEVYLRNTSVAYPNAGHVKDWAEKDGSRADWAAWLLGLLESVRIAPAGMLADFVAAHEAAANYIATGPNGQGPGILWADDAGGEAQKIFGRLGAEADHSGRISRDEYDQLVAALLTRSQVRSATDPHPDVRIWGALEARIQSVDLAILGGLNEGTWPSQPDPDPWMSRSMRSQAGLPSPDRRIGLSAHDFQSAAGAAEVVFSRAIRDEDAATVPSRWLNRLTNLLAGLDSTGGPEALDEMLVRGQHWLQLAEALDARTQPAPLAPRPSPAPPVEHRPRKLSVTQIATLKRDPYAIYAREVLGLTPLPALQPDADARVRGILLHRIFERFVKAGARDPSKLTPSELSATAELVLHDLSDFPAQQVQWRAGIERTAQAFIEAELHRWQSAVPAFFEVRGRMAVDLGQGHSLALTGVADRIDIGPDGSAWIYDYKSGQIPGPKQLRLFDKQLYLLAMMAQAGAFKDERPVPPVQIAGLGYLGIGRETSEKLADLVEAPVASVELAFRNLMLGYFNASKGFTARAQMERSEHSGDYDHLARRGEWDDSTAPTLIRVGQ